MSIDVCKHLDTLCDVLMHPIIDVNLISRVHSSQQSAINFVVSPASRTFLCLSCESTPKRTAVFFLGTSEDRIDTQIIQEQETGFGSVRTLIQEEDPELEAVGMVSISQLVNPVFNSGSEKLTAITVLVAGAASEPRIVGIVFRFPFGIRLGLQIYDDYRLSICFNDTCDAIISQARQNTKLQVHDRQLNSNGKPTADAINWFDWLK